MGFGKSIIIGYRYFAGMHLAICHSPNNSPVDAFERITAADRIAWEGSVTSNQEITIDAPELFGGEQKEGGIQGDVDVEFGGINQGKNAYLQSQLGEDIPGFRGIFGLVVKKAYIAAINPYPKAWVIQVMRGAAKSWYQATSIIPERGNPGDSDYIPGGSTNGVHIIYELLTDPDFGLGLSSSLINDSSFRAAADILFSENFGLSMIFTRESRVEDFIQQVLSHIGAIFYIDRVSGTFSITLIRESTQTELDNAPVFDASNIVEVSRFERPSFAEVINEITLTYRPQGQTSDSSLTVQDLASIQAQGGIVSQALDLAGIDNPTIAGIVASRELKQYSTPLATVSFFANREAWDIEPGDIIKLSWPDLNIETVIIRVFSVNYGTLQDGQIEISGTEDIFSLPSSSYLTNQPSQWTDPVGPSVPVQNQAFFEMPYYEIGTTFNPGDIASLEKDSAFFQFVAQKPLTVASQEYGLWIDVGQSGSFEFSINSPYAPVGILENEISRTDTVISLTSLEFEAQFVETGSYAYINQEVVRIDGIDFDNEVVTIARGCLDTVPQIHSSSSVLFFAQRFDAQNIIEYSSSDVIDGRALVRTPIDVLSIDGAPSSTVTMVGRQDKPYPPGNLTISSEVYPEITEGRLTLSWSHRDRLQQLADIIDTTSGNIGPEPGTSYTVRVYDSTGTNLLTEVTDISETSWSWDNEENENTTGINRVELFSIRDGNLSFQSYDLTFNRSGLGMNLGNYLGGRP